MHQETIGKYVKRIRLKKAAQYLKYTETSVSDIAFEVGFEDIASFSKAFKKKYKTAPSTFRNSNQAPQKSMQLSTGAGEERTPLEFEIEFLPDFEFLCLEYRGAYENISAIEHIWEQLIAFGEQENLLGPDSIWMAELMDDNQISEDIHCRYGVCLVLNRPLELELTGLIKIKQHKRQKYVKFLHKGSHQSSSKTYDHIYANWMQDVHLEFEDLPSLEFFVNDDGKTPPEELLTEIYIPVK